ncbi:hypothetical protein CY34DRAFT_736669 [Suillus luteus UH-Slu-Lm8-n1]|uniref:Uncharacterized protein n=1 Tax=Suillus luteus UH-Slu-Lm8-n1 TaxID=930992 RepID=A0A0D0B9T9_9AGAM|nr:hypothetical protein CY34DRAFT_736669 [Suillus luteus UH-Slu-Lm8-n1]
MSDDFVQLRLHRPSHFRWAPGQTARLIMLSHACHSKPTFSPLRALEYLCGRGTEATRRKYIQVRLRSCSSTPLWTELVFFLLT